MTIDFDTLKNWAFEEQRHQISKRDTMLYALGVGLGMPATDPDQLRFLYEDGLLALPSMAAILGYRGFWYKDPATGVDWKRVLHGEQFIRLYRPLPVEGTVISRQRVSALIDKGAEKGSLLLLEREVLDETGERLALVEQLSVLRGDGGFGRSFGEVKRITPVPDRAPDQVVDLPTLEQAALIYRLSGDYNPLHIDPQVAEAAGFARPILHGLCTFGVIGHAALKACAQYQPARMKTLGGRFTAPVYPGETIRTEIWDEGNGRFALSARARERDVVLFSGHTEIE